ncbi:MAG: IS21 family transposase, partial [Pseudomonadota bacterium]|nr:IS21 family transposase [Pseudomonadota bacterium]
HPLPEDATLAAVLAPPKAGTGRGSASQVEAFRPQVTAWWEAGIQATTIYHALVRQHGFGGSYSAVRRFVQGLQAAHPQATVHLDFAPAEAAQVDFGQGPRLVDVYTGEEFATWVFVMTLCWSRHAYAELVRNQTVPTWVGCHRRAFEWFNGVPRRLTIDNTKCAITRACTRDPEVQRTYADLAEAYGFKIDPCPPREPQKKGRVEAGVKYVKRAFFPLREFRGLADANRQLQDWVLGEAGNRLHGSTRQRPLSHFTQTERALLQALPDSAPVVGIWAKVKVHRDAHVQFEKALYSVPFRLLGQSLWLKATDTLIQIYQDHRLVATHPRLHRPGGRATVADHLPPEALAWRLQDTQWCLHQAQAVGPACQALIERLFADRVLENLRAAQGVIRLGQRFGKPRLEAACARALAFDNPRYRSVKTILEKGLDQLPSSEQAFDTLAESYTGGGRFCRPGRRLLSH